MIFKVVSGVDRRVWDLYNSAQASAEFVMAALDITNQHQDHYKNRVVMNWQTFSPSKVNIFYLSALTSVNYENECAALSGSHKQASTLATHASTYARPHLEFSTFRHCTNSDFLIG